MHTKQRLNHVANRHKSSNMKDIPQKYSITSVKIYTKMYKLEIFLIFSPQLLNIRSNTDYRNLVYRGSIACFRCANIHLSAVRHQRN